MAMDNRYHGLEQGNRASVGLGDPTPLTVNPIDAVHNALAEASSLASRVEILVERLVGAAPTSSGQAGKDIEVTIFGTLRHGADYTTDRIRSAHDALNRLDNQLP